MDPYAGTPQPYGQPTVLQVQVAPVWSRLEASFKRPKRHMNQDFGDL